MKLFPDKHFEALLNHICDTYAHLSCSPPQILLLDEALNQISMYLFVAMISYS